jgi:hypothetical protein
VVEGIETKADSAGGFSLKYFSLLISRLCIDFELHMNPGTSKKVCGGGGRVVANIVWKFLT